MKTDQAPKSKNRSAKVREYSEPRTHVLIPGFLTPKEQELTWREIEANERRFTPGKYEIDWVETVRPEIKKNLVYTVNDVAPRIEDSFIRLVLYNRLFYDEDMIRRFLLAKSPVYQLLRFANHDTTRVSAYADGDFYNWHTDQSPQGLLTVVLMLCREPRTFSGGDFELEWEGATKTIPFENNTVLIFARNTPHSVTPISSRSELFLDRRFTIQCFVDF